MDIEKAKTEGSYTLKLTPPELEILNTAVSNHENNMDEADGRLEFIYNDLYISRPDLIKKGLAVNRQELVTIETILNNLSNQTTRHLGRIGASLYAYGNEPQFQPSSYVETRQRLAASACLLSNTIAQRRSKLEFGKPTDGLVIPDYFYLK